jgi:SAM-dependent methyltransferase
MTYRDTITVLSPDPEGTYFVYRYSDPTFVMAQAILDALSTEPAAFTGSVLDLCGGSGHLTGIITRRHPGRTVVLADMFFWKLWLAANFTAPAALMVCCDANHPLPFAAGAFPTVVLSDAFPYIWHKRALAGEMVRQAGPDGTIVMPHLHSSLGWNFSAGMTLTPRSYQALFEGAEPRLFPDTTLLDQAIEDEGLDLSTPLTAEELGDENSFTLIVSRHRQLFRRFDPPRLPPPNWPPVVNPLYRVTIDGGASELRLVFPTPEYEAEFGACRRYLPDSLRLDADLSKPLVQVPAGIDVDRLRRCRVLIDAPPRYC